MNIPEEKSHLCQISLTGYRALTMLGLLITAPMSLKEIQEKFIEENIMEPGNSVDVIRIDLNTLRLSGCEISRSSVKTNFKYVLRKHPYELRISEEQVNILKRGYKILKDCASIELLLKYDALFRKLASYVLDENIKEQLCGISTLKYLSETQLSELVKDCKEQNTLTFEYRDMGNSKTVQRTVVAHKLELRNDKVYLLGYDLDKKEMSMIPVKRIINVVERKSDVQQEILSNSVEVKFFLKNFNSAGIEDCEHIIESNNDSQIIVGNYENEFIAIQRLLSFGSACIVMEPVEIKQKVIQKLLAMREIYKNA